MKKPDLTTKITKDTKGLIGRARHALPHNFALFVSFVVKTFLLIRSQLRGAMQFVVKEMPAGFE